MSEALILVGFFVLIILMLMVDIGVFHKKNREIGFKEAIGWTLIWVGMALVTWGLIYFFGDKIHGVETLEDVKKLAAEYSHPIMGQLDLLPEGADEKALRIYRKNLGLEYLTGYVIEYSLSIDNIFVIVMIFLSFGVEKIYYHRVLFWGIIGAIVMRFLFIFVSARLIKEFDWILVIFGAFLVATGIKMFLERNKEKTIDTRHHPVIRFTSRFFKVDSEYKGRNFFIRKDGKLYITSLFVVLLVVEFSDVIFAVDSVPAIFSVTKDPYIVYFSNIFAIIGLRSLFFLVMNVMDKFRYLHIGLSFLLAFVGIKMISHYFHIFDITTMQSLFAILGILAASILASIFIPAKKKASDAIS